MVETVDHLLFIVIFSFISHVSKTLFYTLNLSLYISLLLTLFIYLSIFFHLVLTIYFSDSIYPSRAKNTVYFYTMRFVLGTNRQEPIPVISSKRILFVGENPAILE